MKKYYRLSLNCGRRRDLFNHYSECGYIEIFPQKGTEQKKGFFGVKNIPVTTYTGRYEVIAELVDDHFEDIILNKRIEYDKEGVKDIALAALEDLVAELEEGLTCYHCREIEPEIAIYYADKIKEDERILNKYISELTEIEKKINVINEIEKRTQKDLSEEQVVDIKPKTRVRSKKSA